MHEISDLLCLCTLSLRSTRSTQKKSSRETDQSLKKISAQAVIRLSSWMHKTSQRRKFEMMSDESVLDAVQCAGTHETSAGIFSLTIEASSEGRSAATLPAAEDDLTDDEDRVLSGWICQLSQTQCALFIRYSTTRFTSLAFVRLLTSRMPLNRGRPGRSGRSMELQASADIFGRIGVHALAKR